MLSPAGPSSLSLGARFQDLVMGFLRGSDGAGSESRVAKLLWISVTLGNSTCIRLTNRVAEKVSRPPLRQCNCRQALFHPVGPKTIGPTIERMAWSSRATQSETLRHWPEGPGQSAKLPRPSPSLTIITLVALFPISARTTREPARCITEGRPCWYHPVTFGRPDRRGPQNMLAPGSSVPCPARAESC
jgi:hypothetical protein